MIDETEKKAKNEANWPGVATLCREDLKRIPPENGSEKRSQRAWCRRSPSRAPRIGFGALAWLVPVQPVSLIQAGSLLPASCRLHRDFASRRMRKWLSTREPGGRNLHQGFAAAVAGSHGAGESARGTILVWSSLCFSRRFNRVIGWGIRQAFPSCGRTVGPRPQGGVRCCLGKPSRP